MTQTLEQQRAQDAWNKCADYSKDQTTIAKSLPALIMNSGLMQVLAFAQQKKGDHEKVAEDLRDWLCRRFSHIIPKSDFQSFMKSLMTIKDAQDYQAINAEAFAWLKWLRQLAAARKGGK
ncbi:MAG: type III-B CRISPR module-associated protein Cmr5 [Acidobacteriota bacterium]|jgi:CRISPR-associated protein Cmr5|nr:type III-B CRISPR module-associated protein Cmr5 [Acidobacteriota bacterium]